MSSTQTRTSTSSSSSRPPPDLVSTLTGYLWSSFDAISLFFHTFINPDCSTQSPSTGLANRSNVRGVSGSLASRAGGNTTGGSGGSGGAGGGGGGPRVAGMSSLRPAMNCSPAGG